MTLPSDRDSAPRRPSRRALVLLVVVCVAAPLALLAVVLRDDDGAPTPAPEGAVVAGRAEIGERAPDFALPALEDGATVRLSAYRDAPVVVTFFASWCGPCEAELPLLEAARVDGDGTFEVVAVTYDDLRRDSSRFVERLEVTFPVGYDADGEVARRYGVAGIPQMFFIDADGVVRDRVFGIASREALDEPLDRLLGRA